jgi:myo-inositol-1(or 4)-monophosphatase
MRAMDDLELAAHVAGIAGDVLADHFTGPTTVDLKRRFDPVTTADRAAEEAIVEVLRTQRPADGILAEEGSGTAGSGRRWIIDPLDGTVNFVHRIPQISVSVALYDGDAPLVGVVLDPLHDELFAAARGRGATLNGSPIRVSAVTDPSTAVVALGFPYDHDVRAEHYAAAVRRALERVNGLRRMGSAALDLAYVACGRFDGYWEFHVEPWDMASGALIVEEAGGRVTDLAGAPRPPHAGPIVASNALLHDVVLDIAGPVA